MSSQTSNDFWGFIMMVVKVSEKIRKKKANRRNEKNVWRQNLFIFLSEGLISYDKGSLNPCESVGIFHKKNHQMA